MNERNNVYVFGTAARAYASPLPSYEERDERQKRVREEQKRRAKTRIKANPFTVLMVFVTFALVMVSGIIYLNLNFQSTYLSKNVIKLQREVVDLEKSNNATEKQMEDGVNLKKIYKKATKLGMKPMKKSKIVTYTRKKSTEIRCYGDIPEI